MTTYSDNNVAFAVEADNNQTVVAKFVSSGVNSTILLQNSNLDGGTTITSTQDESGELVTSIESIDNKGDKTR